VKITFKRGRNALGDFVSNCGKYEVWVQSQLLNGEIEWGASYKGEFLTEFAGSKNEAVEICREHSRQLEIGKLDE
jgi:hypothetical protein